MSRSHYFIFLFLFISFFAYAQDYDIKNPSLKLNVMSFNIRLDLDSDGENSWPYRKKSASQIIRDQDADIVGLQEVLFHQLTNLLDSLPDYSSVGVARSNGKELGEFSPIFYKTDCFNKINSGTFWLSETPDKVGSKGWDAAYERIVSWAILEDKNTSKKFFVANTHFDHIGKIAQKESVILLLNKTKQLAANLPLIITGDFNSTPDSDPIQYLINNPIGLNIIHTKDIAIEKNGPNWTFHGFARVPLAEREFIDYIFVSDNTKVNKHQVLSEKMEDIFISDHAIVTAQIEF